LLALVLGLVVSAGLYYAYLWPSVEPLEEEAAPAPAAGKTALAASAAPDTAPEPPATPADPGTAAPAPDEAAAPAPAEAADPAPAEAAPERVAST
jgi:hypothetical protein